LLSKRAEQSVFDIMASWKELAIDGWTEGEYPWFYLSETLGGQMASLVGGNENEVIALVLPHLTFINSSQHFMSQREIEQKY